MAEKQAGGTDAANPLSEETCPRRAADAGGRLGASARDRKGEKREAAAAAP